MARAAVSRQSNNMKQRIYVTKQKLDYYAKKHCGYNEIAWHEFIISGASVITQAARKVPAWTSLYPASTVSATAVF